MIISKIRWTTSDEDGWFCHELWIEREETAHAGLHCGEEIKYYLCYERSDEDGDSDGEDAEIGVDLAYALSVVFENKHAFEIVKEE